MLPPAFEPMPKMTEFAMEMCPREYAQIFLLINVVIDDATAFV